MKCYYEELAVDRDANENEIKSAYRKLALKWHPDKNPDCLEEAKERFQLIQQAYEVLSDPQERAWYDNHREHILRGKNSDYVDNCLDVFQYFTVSCFKGYGDDANGFYAIYQEVFKKIAAEDVEFMTNEEELLGVPKFGDSKSSYEDVVAPFYAYWGAYCTRRTYAWLCPYDVKEVKDRKILREIEKDMKKVVQKAKKERNEEVRNLVSFVRKRDKRVQAFKKLLEERCVFNRQKQERNRLEQIRRRQQELEDMRQNNQTANAINDDYEELLKQLEQEYSDDEFYEDVSDQENPDQRDCNGLYCVACNKDFKTEKSFSNHEISRKHRDNVEKLKMQMQDEESLNLQGKKNLLEAEEISTAFSEESKQDLSKHKHKKEAKNVKQLNVYFEETLEEVTENLDNLIEIDKDDASWNTTNKKLNKKCKIKNNINKNNANLLEQTFQAKKESVVKSERNDCVIKSDITQHICATCNSKFESKNKLFAHLKLTNHSIFIAKPKCIEENKKSKKIKGRKK